MNFQNAVRVCLSKYADFNGRASRPEMWFGFLAWLGVIAIASALDAAFFGAGRGRVELFQTIAVVVLILPLLAAQVRRLHDTNRSGWWVVLGVLPIAGFIILAIWWSQKGTAGPNAYGPEPLEASPAV